MDKGREDMIMGILITWTLVGMLGLLVGLHIGWWDVLAGIGLIPSGSLPVDPRHST
jgi:hypothetical protein